MDQTESPFPKIKKADVSDEKLADFKNEADFVGLGIDLMIEVGSYVTIAASILGPDGTWDRGQAAVGGNVVRLYKLFSAMLDQTVQQRRETSFIIARLAFETVVNTQFLIQEHSNDLVDSYFNHSLHHERRLVDKITASIVARDGVILPIDERMLSSIERLCVMSGTSINELPEGRERNWGGKNLFEKAKAVGLDEAYLAMFSGASQNVHGAWGDIYAHHLTCTDDGKFTPNLDWGRPRPQLLFSIAFLSIDVAIAFAGFIGGDNVADLLDADIDDLRQRIEKADRAHEAYLGGNTWPQI